MGTCAWMQSSQLIINLPVACLLQSAKTITDLEDYSVESL